MDLGMEMRGREGKEGRQTIDKPSESEKTCNANAEKKMDEGSAVDRYDLDTPYLVQSIDRYPETVDRTIPPSPAYTTTTTHSKTIERNNSKGHTSTPRIKHREKHTIHTSTTNVHPASAATGLNNGARSRPSTEDILTFLASA